MREIDERHLLPPRNPDLPRIIMYGEAKSFDNPLDDFDQEQLMKDLDIKWTQLEGRIHSKNEDIKDLEIIYLNLKQRVFEQSEQNINQMITELNTGGNIWFEEGK